MNTPKVYKITRKCEGCGEMFDYYRLPNERGRSATNCSPHCKGKTYNKTVKSFVDFADVPKDWQRKLEARAEAQNINYPGAS